MLLLAIPMVSIVLVGLYPTPFIGHPEIIGLTKNLRVPSWHDQELAGSEVGSLSEHGGSKIWAALGSRRSGPWLACL